MASKQCGKTLLTVLAVLAAFLFASCSGDSSLSGSSSANSAQGNRGKKGAGDGDSESSKNGGGGGSAGENGDDGGSGGNGSNIPGVNSETLPDGRVKLTFTGKVTQVVAPVDIVFALDTSGSMDQEKAAMEKNMNMFVSKFIATGSDLDYRIFVIAASFKPTETLDASKFEVVPQAVGSNNALAIFQNFISNKLPSKLKLREDSRKQFVVVSDDDAKVVTATIFAQTIDANPALKGKSAVNGIVGLKTSSKVSGTCELASVGLEYEKLANPSLITDAAGKSMLPGLLLDICNSNWGTLLDNLAKKILLESSVRDFGLDKPANDGAGFSVKVGGRDIGASGFKYDVSKNMIILAPESAPKPGEELVVVYMPKSA